MTDALWTVAAECWYGCLPDLQCMADPSSLLGRAIDQVFMVVYDQDSPQVSSLDHHALCCENITLYSLYNAV